MRTSEVYDSVSKPAVAFTRASKRKEASPRHRRLCWKLIECSAQAAPDGAPPAADYHSEMSFLPATQLRPPASSSGAPGMRSSLGRTQPSPGSAAGRLQVRPLSALEAAK